MDLSQKSTENIHFMVEEIIKKLKMATAAAMNPEHFSIERYEDIKDIYELVSSKSNYSISEMEAIVKELGDLRK
ncbi:DUF1128 domain-containing protein [Chengkuizengella sp. 2205SS18-9]|uniref:UPF0435 protein Q5Y73_20030 n=2 Tax=Chengkuizengella axinellae TaxID=3064388 RepID=A0ABT9J429_9BACL|nr:DUF1128 domain-containing protein [Chengkuizengella sp. 2205SS18-9]MDP5276386.1 DUF1128 domain-containing protein [Chengkuizengella sp. 2205SS18-9]